MHPGGAANPPVLQHLLRGGEAAGVKGEGCGAGGVGAGRADHALAVPRLAGRVAMTCGGAPPQEQQRIGLQKQIPTVKNAPPPNDHKQPEDAETSKPSAPVKVEAQPASKKRRKTEKNVQPPKPN